LVVDIRRYVERLLRRVNDPGFVGGIFLTTKAAMFSIPYMPAPSFK